MNFLPLDYEAPKTSNNYMKLQDGENRIRILSKPVLGWEDWDNKRPIRFEMDKKPARSIDPLKPLKHFWAFVVWNYNEEQVQILELTQATIRKHLEALCKDEDWGSPYAYDIKIMKTGESVNTEYAVNPVPHKLLAPYIAKAFSEKPCNLEALFISADPFSKEWEEYTELETALSQDEFNQNIEKVLTDKKSKSKIENEHVSSQEEASILEKMLDLIPDYKKSVFKFLNDSLCVQSLEGIKMDVYNQIRYAAIAKLDEKSNDSKKMA